jgi:hypothetical protein
MFQRSHHVSIAQRPRCNFLKHSPLCGLSHIYRCHQQRDLDRHQMFGAYHLYDIYLYVYRLYNVGDRTEPCGTPACISLGADSSPSTESLNFLWERKELISLIKLDENFNSDNFYSKPKCHVLSNAFSISKNTAAVDMLLLKFKVTWSVSLRGYSDVNFEGIWDPYRISVTL